MMARARRKNQYGAALISVLLIFAIVTILATQLITRSQADIERTRWLITQAQTYQYALGGEALARQILWQEYTDLKNEGISISPVPVRLPIYQPDYGQMAIEIVDLQGRINLNNISGSAAEQAPVKRLFSELLLKPGLTNVLADWVDSDTTPRAGGAEDFSYISLGQPLRTGNQQLANISELMALKGMPVEEYSAIAHSLSALNSPTAINLNTASAEVFSLLNPDLSEQQVINYREQNPNGFTSVEEFLMSDVTAGLEINSALLTVTSSHYGVKIIATVNDRKLQLFSQLSFDNNSGEIELVSRTLGEEFTINTLAATDADQDDHATQPLP